MPTSAATAASPTVPPLPQPYATPSAVNFATVVGWPEGRTPQAPDGFVVTPYASTGLEYPRWFHVLPNGDVLVSEARSIPKPGQDPEAPELHSERLARSHGLSANRITLLRDADGDGVPEVRETFASGLSQPFGMALLGDRLYVANTDGVLVFPYRTGQTRLDLASGRKILDLPAGGYNNHWTRNIAVGPGGRKLYVTVGSASNVGEYGMDEEHRRACILEIDPDGGNERLYASGLRNPVGLDWEPETGTMWTAVNERDELGDDLVPDYVTSVREGAFYGWPYAYWRIEDPRLAGQRPDLVEASISPDMAVGAHTASLGLHFYRGSAFPERYRGGMFIGQHGSWNRAELSGYKVAFVPFANGRPSGPLEDFLTGFVADADASKVYGRPCGLAELPDGSLLVADDAGDCVWRVAAGRG
jgi:glucose/arabinose dehydrogenase